MTRLRKVLIALDQLLGSLLFDGIAPEYRAKFDEESA